MDFIPPTRGEVVSEGGCCEAVAALVSICEVWLCFLELESIALYTNNIVCFLKSYFFSPSPICRTSFFGNAAIEY